MDNISDLQRRIQSQIETYLPNFRLNDVAVVKKSEKELLITIRVNQTLFTLKATEDGTLRLADL